MYGTLWSCAGVLPVCCLLDDAGHHCVLGEALLHWKKKSYRLQSGQDAMHAVQSQAGDFSPAAFFADSCKLPQKPERTPGWVIYLRPDCHLTFQMRDFISSLPGVPCCRIPAREGGKHFPLQASEQRRYLLPRISGSGQGRREQAKQELENNTRIRPPSGL